MAHGTRKSERVGSKLISFLGLVGMKNSEVPDNHVGGEF